MEYNRLYTNNSFLSVEPMNPDVFQEALMATARVACCSAMVGLVACNAKKDGPEKGGVIPNVTQTPRLPNKQSITVKGPNGSEPVALPKPIKCIEHVTAIFAAKEPQPTETSKACCQTIAEYSDQENYLKPGAFQWDTRNQCCELLQWSGGSMACTPWGPPVPPAMV